jgi:hypothetical protein
LRHNKGGDRRHDREPEPNGVRQDIGRSLMLLDTRRPVLVQVLVAIYRWTPIR